MATSNADRIAAAEARGWVFEFLGASHADGSPAAEGERISAAQGTLMSADDEIKGTQFIGGGEDLVGWLLDQIEEFDRENKRL